MDRGAGLCAAMLPEDGTREHRSRHRGRSREVVALPHLATSRTSFREGRTGYTVGADNVSSSHSSV